MEVSMYLNKYVKVDLENGFYYSGLVTNVDSDSITIEDKGGLNVSIQIKFITFIREVSKWISF